MRSEAGITDVRTGEIIVDGVSVVRDGVRVLRDVSCRLHARRIAVIGANGSGKSTFARLLNGLVVPSEGTVRVHGLDPGAASAAVVRRVGFVFTDPQAQILMPTPREDLRLSLRGTPAAEKERRVEVALEQQGLSAHADVPASALSGGQKQLLALTSVLITEPDLIVADEPMTLLDLRNARRIGDLLLAQTAQIVVVTHDLELASCCDQALLFDGGSLVEVGDPADVISTYRRLCA